MLTTEQMVAFCGAHLIKELAYLGSFLPSCTEKDNNREGMALPGENPEGNNVKHIRMMTLYSDERYSHEEVEEVIEEMKPSLFSADASSSQHRTRRSSTGEAVQVVAFSEGRARDVRSSELKQDDHWRAT